MGNSDTSCNHALPTQLIRANTKLFTKCHVQPWLGSTDPSPDLVEKDVTKGHIYVIRSSGR